MISVLDGRVAEAPVTSARSAAQITAKRKDLFPQVRFVSIAPP
jgi:hypothetical protein